ncbi:MAG: hypothetical protein B6245_01270 [Desulfobacteraceae bacterium 4572_88]|nr:MAG: hypothetical protein B6245_01270 [Desulfobacteraceae bacterium 4572_88]
MMYQKTALIVSILMMMSGCAVIQEFVQKPQISFEGLSLKNMSLSEGDMVFRLRVTNPNPMGATLRNVSYNLKINDREFLKDVLEQNITLAAGGSSMVEVPLTINYLNFFESVRDFIGSDKIVYDLSGSAGIGPFDIPYHTNGDFPVPKLPRVSLKNVSVADFSLTGASVICAIDLKNPNSFAMNMSGLSYSIALDGKKLAEGIAENVSPMNEKGSTVIKVPIRMNFFELGRSAYRMLKKSSSDYELKGEMKFSLPQAGEKSFPFQKSGRVSFSH